MKYIIERLVKQFKSESAVVEFLFCTLGNGIELDNKGFLRGNYKCEETYKFGEPEPFSFIYPWSETERFQPFRELAGCRDVGFRECVEFFLKCLELTPETVDRVKPWKDHIGVVKDLLLNTPPIKDEFSDKNDVEAFITSFKEVPSGKNSVYKTWFFDVQGSDCPEEVIQEVGHMWTSYELGNDNYIVKTDLDDELFEDYPKIYLWLKYKGVKEGERVVIHWWW